MPNTGYHEFAEPRSTWAEGAEGQRSGNEALDACDAAMTFFRQYAREKPEVVALWAFGVGFVLGWKLKPW